MNRARNIARRHVRAAVRISRADCVPVTLPPAASRKAGQCIAIVVRRAANQRAAARVDLREAGEKSAGRNIAHDLTDLAFQLRRFQSADKLAER
jgi:hypothetical protein